ncbi:MAG TPA: hypothetical protein VNZ22_22075 [Bacillota bacterium]|nr:hypothetical protein [Bacillota bacterium]
MKVVPFIAENAAAALAQIHAQLGPEAVVLSVRPLPASGLARLWQKSQAVEVLACVMDASSPSPAAPSIPNPLPASGRDEFHLVPDLFPKDQDGDGVESIPATERRTAGPGQTWRSIGWLESQGLLPALAERLHERLRLRAGEQPPAAPGAEWTSVCGAFGEFWRVPPALNDGRPRPHVFIGPPGSGKTTLLCKWLAKAVLTESSLVRVWRLDGSSANTAEFLNIYGEMFGLPVERFWQGMDPAAELALVDLPGVEAGDTQSLKALQEQLAGLPSPRLHLVLNAAYDTAILFEQLRAFSFLAPEDVSFTHLDEATGRIKLWNFVLGTNCSLRFLSAGQKIPGDFLAAEPARLFPCQNPQ